jgi:AcrR family transcriptional regulator
LPTDPGPPPLGLRERKKARTRAAIQEQALHLFAAQGYAATTVRQIADAAEVSESTFFRYFPTKEDVVMHDRFDRSRPFAVRSPPSSASFPLPSSSRSVSAAS